MYSMHECCTLTGLSYDTLKYYCNQGLIPNVKRDKANNYRVFDDDDINWIKSLICLKKCDFTLNEIKQYVKLCMQGKETIPQRQQMLTKQRKKIEDKMLALKETLNFIDWKTNLYNDFLSGKIDYYSYLKPNNKK